MAIILSKQVNPLDAQYNIAIGISLPFGSNNRLFNSTYSTREQIKSNIINLLLTNKGERLMNPEFGSDIRRLLFEGIDDNLKSFATELITNSLNTFIPQIKINSIDVTLHHDNNLINIKLNYSINISGIEDEINLQFA